jgi:hypothetical protein
VALKDTRVDGGQRFGVWHDGTDRLDTRRRLKWMTVTARQRTCFFCAPASAGLFHSESCP